MERLDATLHADKNPYCKEGVEMDGSMVIKFTVMGEPRGKGRPRFARRGQFVQTYTDDATVSYENLVRLSYQQQCGFHIFPKECMLEMRISCYLPIPKSASKKKQLLMEQNVLRPTKKPDFDNMVKVVCDALNKVAYADDTQIVDGMVRKFYSRQPRMVVSIKEISAQPKL